MKHIDLSASTRITSLMQLMRALGVCKTPFEALQTYMGFVGNAYPDRGHVVLSTRGLPPGKYRLWRLHHDDGTEVLEMRDPWRQLDQPILEGGLFGQIIANPVPQVIHDVDWSHDPHFSQLLTPYRSLMTVPLSYPRLPLNWNFMLHRDPEYFSASDLEESVTRATLVGSMLDSLDLGNELTRAYRQIDQEIERMAQIQRSLLPEPIPNIAGLEIAAIYQTFSQVGGDLYDFIPLNDAGGRWCIFIGDASGHGPSAAVVAAMVQAVLHACAQGSSGPAEIFRTLNEHLVHKRIEASFVTAFLAVYEPATRRFTYASAGHPPPLLIHDGGQSWLNAVGGLPLGIDESANFDEASVTLAVGDALLLYTDGIVEARRPDRQMFESSGLQEVLRKQNGAPPAAMLENLNSALANFLGGHRPNDDQTMVAIRVSE